MDLSFVRFDRDTEVSLMPAELAVLMVGVAARQAASPTALRQASVARPVAAPRMFAPGDGAFNGAMASWLAAWRTSECAVYRGVSEHLQGSPLAADTGLERGPPAPIEVEE